MKKLPHIQIKSPGNTHRQLLAQWIHERRIESILSDNTTDTPPKSLSQRQQHPDTKPPVAIKPGQVRLLFPTTQATKNRLCYMAVLEKCDTDWVVVPFGRYATPAVPGELSTGLTPLHLQILCLWNQHLFPNHFLQASWVVAHLDSEKLAMIKTLHNLLTSNKPLPADLATRVGPPLQHPFDPRHDYLDEERAWIKTLTTSETRTLYLQHPSGNLRMAAEEHESYAPDPKTHPETTDPPSDDPN